MINVPSAATATHAAAMQLLDPSVQLQQCLQTMCSCNKNCGSAHPLVFPRSNINTLRAGLRYIRTSISAKKNKFSVALPMP